jgi:septal ring factor EnvC (AmiA/AmiB activator)
MKPFVYLLSRREAVMTPRYLSRILVMTVSLLPALACAASDDEMLRAFGEASHAKPFIPAETSKPQPTSQPKSTTKSTDQAELTRLRARINQLEKQQAESKRDKSQEALKRQQAESQKKLAALEAENQQQAQNLAKVTQELKAAQQQAADAAQRSVPQQSISDKQLAALQAEKQQLAEEVSTLKQALKDAQQQSRALSDMQKNAEALKVQQIESAKKLATLDAEKKQQTQDAAQLSKQLNEAQEAVKRSQEQLKTQHAADAELLNQQLREAHDAAKRSEDALKQQQAKNIATLTAELNNAKKHSTIALPETLPKSDADRDGYTLGQFIASNAVVQLQMVKDVGLNISLDQLIAGLTTQLKTGTSAMRSEEMSQRYATMQESINKGMGKLIEKGYAQLDKQVEKRKTLRAENGVRWFAVKPAKAKLIPEQQVEVSVKVSTLGGKVINDFADDKVPFDSNLPPLLYDGMSLTGKGGAVEGWALAKDIFEREPLPPWVAPYDVIHYQLAIK